MAAIIVLAVLGMVFVLAMSVRGWQGVALMSDGVSGWAQGESGCTSRCRFSLSKGQRKYFVVAIGGEVDVYSGGFVVRSEMSRFELAENLIESVATEPDGSLVIFGRGAKLRIRDIGTETQSRIAAMSRPPETR